MRQAVSSQGVLAAEAAGGVLIGRCRNEGLPLLVGGAEYVGDEPTTSPTACSGTTKAGNRCRAPKAHGGALCVGHTRSQAAKG